ncbi:50S ribosomal protein L3 [Candidatus Woesebacteria bacterium]|nr:MAG: 50S ribosomal protein L3 [Candidatus Woesebacteria bacterium]
MINSLLGQKHKMSQKFVGDKRVPVTWVKVGPCVITQIKTKDKDGYNAVQFGFGTKNLKNIKKPVSGHLKGAIKDKKAPRFLSEVKVDDPEKYKVGDEINVTDIFMEGDKVSVVGTSRGKGFAGVVKRWSFSGYPRSHGHSGHERRPGSIGQGTTPGRVRKGKKMPGRMGNNTVDVKNLKVLEINKDLGEIAISGTIPGNTLGFLVITKISGGVDTSDKENQVAPGDDQNANNEQ